MQTGKQDSDSTPALQSISPSGGLTIRPRYITQYERWLRAEGRAERDRITFLSFPKLPIEVQRRFWRLTVKVHPPRDVRVRMVSIDPTIDDEADPGKFQILESNPPVAVAVCSESRRIALKTYEELRLSCNMDWPLFNPIPATTTFNFDIDTLDLDYPSFARIGAHYLRHGENFPPRIHRLRLKVDEDVPTMNELERNVAISTQICQAMHVFPALKRLELVIANPSYGSLNVNDIIENIPYPFPHLTLLGIQNGPYSFVFKHSVQEQFIIHRRNPEFEERLVMQWKLE